LIRQTIFNGGRLIAVLGLLYDIHGNLVALDAVIAAAADVDRWLLGGDYGVVSSPWQAELLDRLRGLPNATWIRGNGERWLLEPPVDRPEVVEHVEYFDDAAPTELKRWLFDLPPQADFDGVLYVHGSPLADDDSFDSAPREDDERLLAGVHDRTIVFGHSHLQFQRPGPNGTYLVNPGSVGSPRHGEPNAAWAVRRADGDFELRRSDYDTERAIAGFRERGGPHAEFFIHRIETGSD
jgi:diadenosine tetraphosphatase ApaH/serine/threonine PP2A family protein phosphatase